MSAPSAWEIVSVYHTASASKESRSTKPGEEKGSTKL